MRKETVNVLKGIAGVGAAIGGAAAFNETDVVYANQFVNSENASEQEELELDQKASEIDSSIDSLIEASTEASTAAKQSLSLVKAQSESVVKELESESVSISEQISEANSTWASTSAYLPTSTSEAMSELGIASEVASEATKNYDYYSNLVNEIETVRENISGLKKYAIDNPHWWYGETIKGVTYNGKDYYGHAGELAKLLIKYKLYVTENVIIQDSQMAGSFAEGYREGTDNYLWVDVNGTRRYFDYVNIGTSGNHLSNENNAKKIISICVLEKTLSSEDDMKFTGKGTEWFGEAKDITDNEGIVILTI